MASLHLSVLPAPQRALWEELAGLPEAFVLYGGTALALQLGHRESVDFDLAGLPASIRRDLTQAVRACDPLKLPQL